MFLYDLKPTQQQAFLRIAQEFMRVDGVQPEEENLLKVFCRETGLKPDDAAEEPLSELLAVFDTRKARVSIMLELIGLGYIDQDFSADEQEFLLRFVDEFGWDRSEFDMLENWILRQIALMQDAEELREMPQV